DDRQLLVDERVRSVLHLAPRGPLGVDVRELLQLERPLERGRVVHAAAEEQEVARLVVAVRERADLGLLAQHGVDERGKVERCREQLPRARRSTRDLPPSAACDAVPHATNEIRGIARTNASSIRTLLSKTTRPVDRSTRPRSESEIARGCSWISLSMKCLYPDFAAAMGSRAIVSTVFSIVFPSSARNDTASFVTTQMPPRSTCGCAFCSLGRPWVAQRV